MSSSRHNLSILSGVEHNLGRGRFGLIKRGRINYQIVACKPLYPIRDEQYTEHIRKIEDIMQDMQKIRHCNLVEYLGCSIQAVNNQYSIKEMMPYVLYEVMSCSLYDVFTHHIKTLHHQLFIEDILDMSIGIIAGLSFLHSHKIIHHNLSPKNILLTSFGNIVKISDYGLPSILNAYSHGHNNPVDDAQISVLYSAPEAINLKASGKDFILHETMNIYNYGVILLQMMCQGDHPRLDRRKEQVDQVISSYPYIHDIIIPILASSNPTDRPSAEAIYDFLQNIQANDKYYKHQNASIGKLSNCLMFIVC
jgi:serine/threonine protein kinase